MDNLLLDLSIRAAMSKFLLSKDTRLGTKQELLRHIEARPAFANPDPIIPLDDLGLRLELITEIQRTHEESGHKTQRDGDGRFHFTTLQMSYLLLMPMEYLRCINEEPMATYLPWLNLEAYIYLMVRGRMPEDIFTGRCMTPQASVDSICSRLASSTISACQNTKERDKCLARDGGACILTGAAFPEACHIIPFAINALMQAKQALLIIALKNSLTMSLLDDKHSVHVPDLLGSGIGCSDKVWNMLCLHATLRDWWSECLFGLKCLGILPSSDNDGSCTIQLQFHWMPRNGINPQDYNQPGHDIIQKMLQIKQQDPDLITESRKNCSRRLETGHVFSLLMPGEDAAKMKQMIDIQWANVRLAAFFGVSGN